MAEREDELLNHDYDGIQEYDNNLPKWWVYLFYITIIFAVVYVPYYHMGPGLSQTQVLANEMQAAAVAEAAKPVVADPFSEESLAALVGDAGRLAAGKAVFTGKCLACHGASGEGLVGPNLTDDFWIHGGALTDMRRTVINGVPAKGMVPWKGLLTDDEINSVVVFIRSLRGTNPPNAKQPEGQPYAPAV